MRLVRLDGHMERRVAALALAAAVLALSVWTPFSLATVPVRTYEATAYGVPESLTAHYGFSLVWVEDVVWTTSREAALLEWEVTLVSRKTVYEDAVEGAPGGVLIIFSTPVVRVRSEEFSPLRRLDDDALHQLVLGSGYDGSDPAGSRSWVARLPSFERNEFVERPDAYVMAYTFHREDDVRSDFILGQLARRLQPLGLDAPVYRS